MAKDVRIWNGTAWQSVIGPTAVSANAGNLAKLGTDGLILVAQADLDGRYVNVTGDTMTGRLIVPDGTAAAPGISFNDATGLHQPLANTLSVITAGADRLRVRSDGHVAIGGVGFATARLAVTGAVAQAGNAIAAGVYNQTVFSADAAQATKAARAFWSAATAAATQGFTEFSHFYVSQGVAADTANHYGFFASVSGATNNYAFYAFSPAGSPAGRWNFYAAGPAPNAFEGQVRLGFGSATSPSLSFIGDENCGLYRSAVDSVSFASAGLLRLTVNSTGQIVAGTGYVPGSDLALATKKYVDDKAAAAGAGVSANAGNLAKLGTDSKVLVAKSDLDALYVNVAGDWMSGPLALGGAASFAGTAPLDIDASTIRLRQTKTPASENDTGEPGTICWDDAYLYACISPNEWRRVAWRDWSDSVTGGAWALPQPTGAGAHDNLDYVGGLLIGNTGRYSEDGTTWTLPSTGFQPNISPQSRTVYGKGTWLVTGTSKSSSLFDYSTSSDGKSWTKRSVGLGTLGFTTTTNNMRKNGLAYGRGRFVAHVAGSSSNSRFIHSADGLTWAMSALPTGLPAGQLLTVTAVAYKGNDTSGIFVAFGLASPWFLTSTDGIAWTARSLPVGRTFTDCAVGNGRFVAIATGNECLHSIDGINWSVAAMPATADWVSVTYGGGRWIAIASGTSAAATSSDGINWTSMAMPSTADWRTIAYNGNVFVATNGTTTPAVFSANPTKQTFFPITASTTLVLAHESATVANVSTGTSPVRITIPDNATTEFPIGASITIMDTSNNAVTTIKASAGVTLNWTGKLVGSSTAVLGGVAAEVQIPGPLSQVLLRKTAADTWVIIY